MTSAPPPIYPDAGVQRLLAGLASPDADPTPVALRRGFADFVAAIEVGVVRPAVERVTDETIAGPAGPIPIRRYEPAGGSRGPAATIVFLHGGGWTLGDLATADLGARSLSAGLAVRVVSVDYRLAPEHPFPAALDDTLCVLRAVAQWPAAGRLIVAGESAGANLAAAAALACRSAPGPRLSGQILINPCLDAECRSASHRDRGEGYGLTTAAVRRFTAWYAGSTDPLDPQISPLRAGNLTGVAPALIVTAGFDPLCDDGSAYAARLVSEHIHPSVVHMPTMLHGWWAVQGSAPGARLATRELLDAAASFLERTAPGPDDRTDPVPPPGA